MINTEEKANGTKTVQVRILVCLSASPSSRRVIEAAAKLLGKGRGIALYVGGSRDIPADSGLYENMRYARDCGFEISTAHSSDIALTISEYAKRFQVTDLFIGYTAPAHFLQTRRTVSEKLIQYLPDTDIHIIPDARASSFPADERTRMSVKWSLRDAVIVIGVMAVSTMLCLWFDQSPFSNANIITIYILGVLISSVMTSHAVYGLFAAFLYVLLFNYLFIDPRYTLLVYDTEYLVTYLVSVTGGLIAGSLTTRLKNIARTSAENAYQAKVLLDTSNQLEQAGDIGSVISITCRQLGNLLNRTVLYYPEGHPDKPAAVSLRSQDDNVPDLTDKDREAVVWTMQNHHYSGAYTSRFESCRCRYLCVYSERRDYGVIAVDMDGHPFTEFENTILLSILHEFTMAMDNREMAEERKEAEMAIENERLRTGLLRSISHDLRTPLTSIYGNACNLADNQDALSREDRQKIYEDMKEDSEWLSEQMENILAMSKLENTGTLSMSTENVEDVITESIRHAFSHPHHTIVTELPEEPCFAEMNSQMIMQVLVNLINNAIKYTPHGSVITVSAKPDGDDVLIAVRDNGNGISDEDKKHIFELFYTGRHTLSDTYRSMGVGLNLCMIIVRAHGSAITVADNDPNGAVFMFRLKRKKVDV